MSPRPVNSSSQISFTAWLRLGISKPSTSSSHLRLLCNSDRMPWPKHRLGLTLAAPPRKPQGQHTQWTATDHIGEPAACPCTVDPPERVEVGGQWSQPVLTADWPGKYLPLTRQHQSMFIYKRRVYSAHTKDTPQVPSLTDRGGCATGPYGPHYKDTEL